MRIEFSIAMGSTYIGVEGWQAGNFFALSTQRNGWAITGNFCGVSQVGLYADPYKTGVAPQWQTPDHAVERQRCQRYWYKAFGLSGGGTYSATGVTRAGMRHPVPMRVTPAGSIVGTPKVYDLGATPTITALATVCNPYAAEFDFTCAAGGLTAVRAAAMYYQTDNDYIAMNARMT